MPTQTEIETGLRCKVADYLVLLREAARELTRVLEILCSKGRFFAPEEKWHETLEVIEASAVVDKILKL